MVPHKRKPLYKEGFSEKCFYAVAAAPIRTMLQIKLQSSVGIAVANPVIARPFFDPLAIDFFKPIADRTMAAIQPITYSGARNQEKMNDVAANTIPLMPPATPKLFSFACVMISLEICEWCRSATKSYQLLRYLSAKR
jgi:hypothetical protein